MSHLETAIKFLKVAAEGGTGLTLDAPLTASLHARLAELESGLQAEPCFCYIIADKEAWHTCGRCRLLGTAKAKRNADQNCGECHGNGEVEKDGRLGVCLSCFPPV